MSQEKIGRFIAECRKKKKMTQEELAVKLGVNSRSISRWENGICLPDISLYNELCKELGITVNEFLSGEKVSEDEYQEKFEENIIEVVKHTDDRNRFYNRLGLGVLLFIVFIILYLLAMYFINNFKWEQPYDKDDFGIDVDRRGINFIHQRDGEIKYLITQNKEDYIVFITFYQTIAEKFSSVNYYNNMVGYDLTDEYYYSREILLDDNNGNERILVYYTNESFAKIAEANTKELKEIIDNSHILYDSNT